MFSTAQSMPCSRSSLPIFRSRTSAAAAVMSVLTQSHASRTYSPTWVLASLWQSPNRKKWYDQVVVVATADHGESLGEHGESTHGYFIYQSTMHVPLLIKAPGTKTRASRIGESVSLIDLAPTLLSLSGAG